MICELRLVSSICNAYTVAMTSLPYLKCSSGFAFYLGVLVILISFQLFANQLTPILEYDRTRLIQGEYWRFITGHLIHLSWYHWLVNSAGLLLILFVLPVRSYFIYEASLVIVLAFSIGIGLFWFAPDLIYYVGLSGILHGIFVTAIWRSPYYSSTIRRLVLVLIVIKMLWEFSSWYDPWAQASQLGGRVEARAHLIGVVVGFMWRLVEYFISKNRLIGHKRN